MLMLESSYSCGRGKSVGHSSYNVRKAYVTDVRITPDSLVSTNASTPTGGLRRTFESYSDLKASVYVKKKGPLKATIILETKRGD
nr:hypothetical protein [Tanacetum cinerariifolium]GEY53278.1 3-beta hydroxysteroid dehydrogenase/isomerase [Tanacetum cinerariifolium]